MSLILDALRRADSERERGTVPGLNAQPEPVAAEPRAQPRTEPWVWMGAGVGIGLAVVLGAYVFGRDAALNEAVRAPSAADAPSAGSATASAGAVGAAGAAVADGAALPVAGAAPVGTASALPGAAPSAAPGATPGAAPGAAPANVAAVAQPAPWPAVDPRPAARADARKAAAAAGDAGAPARPAALPVAAAAEPVVPVDQLPASLRAQMPALAFGGSMYSANPANRSLIINGQIHRENDRVGTDLTLVEIRPRGAVFSFRGRRVEVPY